MVHSINSAFFALKKNHGALKWRRMVVNSSLVAKMLNFRQSFKMIEVVIIIKSVSSKRANNNKWKWSKLFTFTLTFKVCVTLKKAFQLIASLGCLFHSVANFNYKRWKFSKNTLSFIIDSPDALLIWDAFTKNHDEACLLNLFILCCSYKACSIVHAIRWAWPLPLLQLSSECFKCS